MATPFRIVAAVDPEHSVTSVLSSALELASLHPTSELHILTVQEFVVAPATMLIPGIPAPVMQSPPDQKRLRELSEATFNAFAAAHPGATLPSVVIHAIVGRPADEIVWLAAHLSADAIIMGTHGRRGLRRMLLGSVAEKVVRLAGCQVHVLREKSHDPTWALPEIEPLCDACAKVRESTKGAELWCARHSEHHIRAHVYSSSSRSGESLHAWSSTTGT